MRDRMTDPPSVLAVGQFLRFQTRSFSLPDGTSVLMDWVGHPGAAAVVAVDGDGRICLLRQYRPIMGAWMWEIPAGKRAMRARRPRPRRGASWLRRRA